MKQKVMIGNHGSAELGSELGLFLVEDLKALLKASVFESGYPSIQVYDHSYVSRFLAALDEGSQKIHLKLKGTDGKERISLEVDNNNAHHIKTFAEDGAQTGAEPRGHALRPSNARTGE